MTDGSNTAQIDRLAEGDRARQAREALEHALAVRLSSDIEAALERHLHEHGSLVAGDRDVLVARILREVRRGTARSPVPAVMKTALFLAFAQFVLPVLNIVIPPIWLLIAAFPMFVLLHAARVNRTHITRALAHVAKSKGLE